MEFYNSNHSAIKQVQSDLVAELRQAINKEATWLKRLLLTFAVYGEKIIDDNYYDVPRISENVDWIVFLAYNLHGYWYGTTGHHSPLFADISKGQIFSVDEAVIHWTDQGTPDHKIVIALTSFGMSYTLTGEQTGVGAPATAGAAGPYLRDVGRLAYYEICNLTQDKGTVVLCRTKRCMPVVVSGNQWVSYDNIYSVMTKISYIKDLHLGGFAFFLLDFDDFKGVFCGEGVYPLLTAANKRCDE